VQNKVDYEKLFNYGRNIKLDCKIGEGGEGEVYKSQPIDGIVYAIKLFRLDTNNAKELERRLTKIIKEFQLFKNIHHSHLINYLYLDVPKVIESNRGFVNIKLVMKYVKGVSLSTLIKKLNTINRFLERSKVVGITRNVLHAIKHLHSLNIVHRDLKPSNIIVDEEFEAHLTD